MKTGDIVYVATNLYDFRTNNNPQFFERPARITDSFNEHQVYGEIWVEMKEDEDTVSIMTVDLACCKLLTDEEKMHAILAGLI